MIESRTTRQFREAFASLPEDVRQHARRAYRLFRAHPRHASLMPFQDQVQCACQRRRGESGDFPRPDPYEVVRTTPEMTRAVSGIITLDDAQR